MVVYMGLGIFILLLCVRQGGYGVHGGKTTNCVELHLELVFQFGISRYFLSIMLTQKTSVCTHIIFM